MFNGKHSEESKKKIREGAKKNWQDEEYRKRTLPGVLKGAHSEKRIEKARITMSETIKKWRDEHPEEAKKNASKGGKSTKGKKKTITQAVLDGYKSAGEKLKTGNPDTPWTCPDCGKQFDRHRTGHSRTHNGYRRVISTEGWDCPTCGEHFKMRTAMHVRFCIEGKEHWLKGKTKETDSRVVGHPKTEEQKLKNSETWKKWAMDNPDEFKAMQKKMHEARSEKAKGGWDCPDCGVHLKRKGGHSAKHDEAVRARYVEATKALWEDDALRHRMLESLHSPENRAKAGVTNALNWEDPEFMRRVRAAQGAQPNKKEMMLLAILEGLQPGVWRYVGDGQLAIGRRNPDFWDGDKKVIELYGDYWHEGEDEDERIKYFKERGFDTLIVWESKMAEMIDGISAFI